MPGRAEDGGLSWFTIAAHLEDSCGGAREQQLDGTMKSDHLSTEPKSKLLKEGYIGAILGTTTGFFRGVLGV